MQYQLREVVIEITKRCNLACIHCGSSCNHNALADELSTEEWQIIFFQFSLMGVEKIVFSGGEPTLKKGFEKLLLCASGIGLRHGFISNGSVVFGEGLREAIKQAKPFAVGLSIDGLKETHNKIRRSQNSWQGLMQNISLLKQMNVQICAVTTLHKMNFRELPCLAEFLDAAQIDSWQIQLAMPTGRMKQRINLLITEEDFMELCKAIMLLRKLYPHLNIQAADCFGLAPANLIRSDFWTGCTAGISSIGIDSRGNVMPCLSLQEGQYCGNLRKESLAVIWERSDGFYFNRAFQSETVKGNCVNCGFLKDCRGGCNSQSFSYFNRFHSSPFCFTRSFYTEQTKEAK